MAATCRWTIRSLRIEDHRLSDILKEWNGCSVPVKCYGTLCQISLTLQVRENYGELSVSKYLCKKLVQIRPHPVLIQRMASLRLAFLTNSLVTREKLDQFETIVEEAQQDPGRVA